MNEEDVAAAVGRAIPWHEADGLFRAIDRTQKSSMGSMGSTAISVLSWQVDPEPWLSRRCNSHHSLP